MSEPGFMELTLAWQLCVKYNENGFHVNSTYGLFADARAQKDGV